MTTYFCDLFAIDTPATHMMLGYENGVTEIINLMDDEGTILRYEIGPIRESTERFLAYIAAGVKHIDVYEWNSLCERARRNRGTKK